MFDLIHFLFVYVVVVVVVSFFGIDLLLALRIFCPAFLSLVSACLAFVDLGLLCVLRGFAWALLALS